LIGSEKKEKSGVNENCRLKKKMGEGDCLGLSPKECPAKRKRKGRNSKNGPIVIKPGIEGAGKGGKKRRLSDRPKRPTGGKRGGGR